jgi:hypothetical protein
MGFDLTKYRSIFTQPQSVINESYWKEHFPVAFLLVEVLQPEIFVELGVYQGGSFNVFCDAVKTLQTNTKCYGVDNWQGDPHNQFYESSVYHELVKYHRENYPAISVLLKMSFDEALAEFPGRTIDLLHIDGYHLYEAVKQDFEGWLPKMSDRGVIIFHDTNYRERDYGVWKLWEEISGQYPSYEFEFGCGLGVLAVGKQVDPVFLSLLAEFNANPFYHDLFLKLGSIFNLNQSIDAEKKLVQILRSQLETVGRELIAVNVRLIDVNKQREEAVLQLEITKHQLTISNQQLEITNQKLAIKEKQSPNIAPSFNWRLSRGILKAVQKFCPEGSFCRKLSERIFKRRQ